jgi:hypothetical protein
MANQSFSDYAKSYVNDTTPASTMSSDSTGPDLKSADFWIGIVTAALELAKMTGVLHDQGSPATQHVDSNVEEYD